MPIAAPTLSVLDLADGGSYLATLTGGDPAATNTLYAALWQGDMGQTVWGAAGSRTGPGTVGGTLTVGYRWWYVKSVLGAEAAVSDLTYQNLTDGQDALQQRIRDAVVAGLIGLALSTPAGPVRVYDLEVPLPERVGFPAIVVTDWTLTETARGGTTGKDEIGFPVSVSMLFRDMDEGNKRLLKQWRELVSRKFRYQPLAGVLEVHACEPEYGPIVDFQAQVSEDGRTTNYLCKGSSMVLRFVARQARGV